MPLGARICLLACIGASALAGCGSDDQATIPPENSGTLIAVLDGIQANVADGNCDIARQQADEFRDQVDLLPAEVDDEVKQGLFEVAGNLEELTRDPSQCADATGSSGPTGAPEPADEPATSPTSAPTTTTTTTTTDEETSTTTTQTEPTTPDDGGPSVPPPPADGGTGSNPTSGGIGGQKAGSG